MTVNHRNKAEAPLVMVHGLIGSLDYFGPADRLPDLSIHAIDLLGYGTHANVDPCTLSLSSQVTHVLASIEALGG